MEKSKVISPNIKDDLIGAKVKHKIFGIGTITSIDEPYILVEFAAGEKKFLYPNAFESFITAEDPYIQCIIEEIIGEDTFPPDPQPPIGPQIPIGSKDTFIFKGKEITYKGTSGYVVCDLSDLEVGVVWKYERNRGDLAEEQAEIRFFDEFKSKYNTWRRIFINHQRLSFIELEDKIKAHGSVTLKIDPQRERKKR
jgi:hypothetical protein